MKKDTKNSCKRPPTEAESRLTKAKLDVDTERYGNKKSKGPKLDKPVSPVAVKLIAENIKLKKELEDLKKKVKPRSASKILAELIEGYQDAKEKGVHKDAFTIEYIDFFTNLASVCMEYPDGEEYFLTLERKEK